MSDDIDYTSIALPISTMRSVSTETIPIYFTADNTTVRSAVEDDSGHKVNISQETVNLLLICIIVIAVFGIIIGLICRKDVGGIKTKCCRTKKSEPRDQVHPADEIPLNKLP